MYRFQRINLKVFSNKKLKSLKDCVVLRSLLGCFSENGKAEIIPVEPEQVMLLRECADCYLRKASVLKWVFLVKKSVVPTTEYFFT